MPALVVFNRRWRIGSDDLVFAAAAGLIIRFLWLIGLASIYGYYDRDIRKCNASLELEFFFIGTIIVTSLVIANEIAIMYVSMQGTVTDVRPRRHMPILLYIQVVLYLPEVSWTILGTYWVVNKSINCELGVNIAVWVSVVLQWSILLAVLIGVMVMFDPLGTLHSHDDQQCVGDGILKESTKKLWEKRCRLLCCCFAGRDDQYLSAISDVADILACQLHDIDVVPSDVAVGLILLKEEQEREEREKKANGELTQKGQPVNFNDAKEKSLVEDAVYFMKFALGCYGWPLYMFMNPCTGPCNLCMGIRWCQCCRAGPDHILGDNCCLCNSAGLKLQTDLEDIHVVFFSYHNKIYEVPFYVAVDHSRKSIVVAVRGSLSMQDALTDLTGQCEELNIEGIESSFAHKGILRCACYVKSVLEERQLLETAFSHATEDYRLVVVGHSLGAGTASLLSVLLKPRYPNLFCFAYSNPSVLSASTTPYCEDFIVSVVLGKDAIPRLGVNRLNELRQDLISVIRRCSVSKYRVLMTGCWKALFFLLGPRPPGGEGEARVHFYSRFRPYRCTDINLSWENSMTQPLLADMPDDTSGLTGQRPSVRYLDDKELEPGPESVSSPAEQLYPAGKILHIDERPCIRISRPRYDVMWADKENYTKLIIHPGMLSDHMPDHVMKALNGILVKEPQVHEV